MRGSSCLFSNRLRNPLVFVSQLMLLMTLLQGLTRAEDIVIAPVLLRVLEEAQIPALEEGAILKVLVKEGDTVSVGDPLVQIDDRLSVFKRDKAEVEHRIAARKALDSSAVNLAETESKVANAALQRALESRRKFKDTPSQSEVDELELRLAQAKQHLERAQTDWQLAKLSEELAKKTLDGAIFELERHTIRALIPGTVVEVNSKPGDWVRPGDLLARVVRTDRLRAEGHIRRDLIKPNLKGATVRFVTDGEERDPTKHLGKLVFLSVEVDPNDFGQRIIAEIDNAEGKLGPGLRGKLIISLP